MPPQEQSERVRLTGPGGKIFTIPANQAGPFLRTHPDYDIAASAASAAAAAAGPSTYDRLTSSGYDPALESFDKAHPVLGKAARFFSSVGGTVMGMPGAVYHAAADPATSEETKAAGGPEEVTGPKRIGLAIQRLSGLPQAAEAAKTYADPKTRPSLSGALSVLPEALGQGTGTVAAAEIGGAATRGALKGVSKGVDALRSTPESGIRNLTKATTSGVTPDFGPRLRRVVERGHLPEVERQYHPKTVREASTAVLDYADKLQKDVIGPAVARHPTETISNDAVAKAIQDVVSPEMEKFYPESIKPIAREVGRYTNKPITLPDAKFLLERLNAINRTLSKAAPESAAAARRIDVMKTANTAAADAIRQQLYGKLDQLGEPGIANLQKDYGALRTVGEALRSNITKAERIGTGPSLARSAFQKHPWLTLAAMGGGYGLHTPAFAAIPVMEWLMERTQTPNAMTARAFKGIGRGGEVMIPETGQPPATSVSTQSPAPTPAPLTQDALNRANIAKWLESVKAEQARKPAPGLGSQAIELWQQSAFGKEPAPDIGATVRAKNPEPTRAESRGPSYAERRLKQVAKPGRDMEILSRVRAEHPEWTLSKQLQEAAKRAQETGD